MSDDYFTPNYVNAMSDVIPNQFAVLFVMLCSCYAKSLYSNSSNVFRSLWLLCSGWKLAVTAEKDFVAPHVGAHGVKCTARPSPLFLQSIAPS